MNTLKIGVTGGIGSGKSYVCKTFQNHFGIKVYDTDRRTQDDIILREHIKNQIINEFGTDSYINNTLNKDKFRELLFDDKSALNKMNDIIKPELNKDIEEWANKQNELYVIIECAIIFENNFETLFNKIITITTPLELRIKRLLDRGMDYDKILKIMNVQLSDEEKTTKSDYIIVNNNNLLEQITDINDILNEKIV